MRITGGLMNQFDFGVNMPMAEAVGSENIEVKLGEIFFANNSSEVSPRFVPMIQELAERLRQSDGGVLTIAGHGQECVATPAPAPVATSQSRGYNLTPHFDTRKAVLKANDKAELDRIINEWRGANSIKVVTIGHTDSIGIASKNQKEFKDNYQLSQARADSVAAYVARQLGLHSSQIYAEGRGPDSPVATNKTAAGRAANRRVDLQITGEFTQSVTPAITTSTTSCSGDIAAERARKVYDLLKPYLGEDMICKVSFRSSSGTYAPGKCGGVQ